MTRRQAREQAFCLLFEKTFKELDTIEEILADAIEGGAPETDSFTLQVAQGVLDHQTTIDDKIESLAKGWKLTRLPRVTLSILRLAMYEMTLLADIPISVSINEAVELAKKYATEEDASYINGVLAALATELGESKEPGKPREMEPQA